MRHGSLCSLALILGVVAAPLQAAERNLQDYLPDDTQAVLSVNVKQILDAPLSKRYLEREVEKLVKNEDLQKIVTLLDFDPLTDLYRVSVAVPEKAQEGKATILIEGSFDPDRIHKVIVQFFKDAKVHKGTVPVYETRNDKGQTFFTAVIDTKFMVVSTDFVYMDEVIAKDAGRRKTKVDPRLAAVVAKQDPKQALWAVAVVTDQVKELVAKNPQAKRFAGKVDSVVAGINITEDIKLNVRLGTTSEDAARELRDTVAGLKTLANFALAGNKDIPQDVAGMLTEVLNSVQVTQVKDSVTLQMTVSGKIVDKAALMSGKFGK
ncbi:MAG: hypothetical protein AB7K24_28865 [Gemmataceae bacterium]